MHQSRGANAWEMPLVQRKEVDVQLANSYQCPGNWVGWVLVGQPNPGGLYRHS